MWRWRNEKRSICADCCCFNDNYFCCGLLSGWHMTKEEKIKEVMEAVNLLTTAQHLAAKCSATEVDCAELEKLARCKAEARRRLESKLRELVT